MQLLCLSSDSMFHSAEPSFISHTLAKGHLPSSDVALCCERAQIECNASPDSIVSDFLDICE